MSSSSSADTAPTSGPGLTSAEAAARLGVKRATLYAYVSRGLITRRVGPDGRTSRFDPAEIDGLSQRRRATDDDGEVRTRITTAITRVDDQRLTIRGLDLVGAVDNGLGFSDVVDLLWESPPGEPWPSAVEALAAQYDGEPTPPPTHAAPRCAEDHHR